jgi:hypothetical protein
MKNKTLNRKRKMKRVEEINKNYSRKLCAPSARYQIYKICRT